MRNMERQKATRQEFIEAMAEKFNHPLRCPGEEQCEGYIYYWGKATIDWDTAIDSFEPELCACSKGEAIRVTQEQLKTDLLEKEKMAERDKAFRARLAGYNLPPRYMKYTLKSYQNTANGQQKWLPYLEEWLKSWPDCDTGLILLGGLGVGKTGLSVGLACELARQFPTMSLYFANVADMVTQLWGSWGRHDGSDCVLVDRMKQADLLILDDLGAGHKYVEENGEERTPVRYLYEILDSRYSYTKPTIITTNSKTLKELLDIVGPRTMNRIIDYCKFIQTNGENLRGRGAI
jgi:DNA replication protein DnaC